MHAVQLYLQVHPHTSTPTHPHTHTHTHIHTHTHTPVTLPYMHNVRVVNTIFSSFRVQEVKEVLDGMRHFVASDVGVHCGDTPWADVVGWLAIDGEG